MLSANENKTRLPELKSAYWTFMKPFNANGAKQCNSKSVGKALFFPHPHSGKFILNCPFNKRNTKY